MPEGHTVHRLARTFGDLFGGAPVAVTSPQGRFAPGAALLDGRVLVHAQAFGKQMFLGFAPRGPMPGERVAEAESDWLRVHLGLYGSWTFAGDGSVAVVHAIGAPRRRVGETETSLPDTPDDEAQDDVDGPFVPAAPRGQVRVRILGEHAVADLTGPTACEVVTDAERLAVVTRLGPDPIRDDADPQRFVDRAHRSRTAIGLQLMNQDVIAGVGNIYRAEALFRAGLDPSRPGTAVPKETLRALWDDLVGLMRDGVRTGRIVTTRPEHRGRGHELGHMDARRVRQNTDGDPNVVSRDESFYVYHRDGLACRVCGTPVQVRDAAGRNLFWCPTCQS